MKFGKWKNGELSKSCKVKRNANLSKACSALVTQHYKNYVNFEEKLLSTSVVAVCKKLDQQTSTVSSTEVKAIKSNNLQASFEYKKPENYFFEFTCEKTEALSGGKKTSTTFTFNLSPKYTEIQYGRDLIRLRHKDNKITHNFNEEQMTDEEKSLVANAGGIIRGLVSFSPLVDGQEIIVGKKIQRDWALEIFGITVPQTFEVVGINMDTGVASVKTTLISKSRINIGDAEGEFRINGDVPFTWALVWVGNLKWNLNSFLWGLMSLKKND